MHSIIFKQDSLYL